LKEQERGTRRSVENKALLMTGTNQAASDIQSPKRGCAPTQANEQSASTKKSVVMGLMCEQALHMATVTTKDKSADAILRY